MANRYQNIPIKRTAEGKQYISTTLYPSIPFSIDDIYVITGEGDRYDLLANQYYKDATLWWVISLANPQTTNASLIPGGGLQIRIPFPIQDIIAEYNALNE